MTRRRGKGALREAWEKRHKRWLKEQHAKLHERGIYKGRHRKPHYWKRSRE